VSYSSSRQSIPCRAAASAPTRNLNADWSEDGSPARCYSKTLFGLNSGQNIYVEISYIDSSSSSKDIVGNSDGDTYMSIHKVG
jgi:hypothetical protein